MSPVEFTILLRRYADTVMLHRKAALHGSIDEEMAMADLELDAAKALLKAASHTPPDNSTLTDLLFGIVHD